MQFNNTVKQMAIFRQNVLDKTESQLNNTVKQIKPDTE